MTSRDLIEMESQYGKTIIDCLHQILFDILLTTDGRTTDMLETLMDEKMIVHVIRQEQINEAQTAHLGKSSGASYYVRESVLISDKSNYIVSHNIALVDSQYVSNPMFEALASKQEGIGKAISSLGLQTLRKVTDHGWIDESKAVDLFQKPLKLRFPLLNERAPYKKYCIYFSSTPGIYLLEYFNPNIIRHRLKRFIDEKHGRGD